MKNLLLLITAFTIGCSTVTAQTIRTLKKVLEFKMPKNTGDENAGANGASIVWHSSQNKYYAAMAGNSEFPLAVFDVTGQRLSDDNLTTQIDLRGLWYNPKKDLIYGNGYNDNGWFHYTLDSRGTAMEINIDIAEMKQPNAQSVGTYNSQTNEVLFLNGNQVSLYSNVGSSNGEVKLRPGLTKKDDKGEKFEESTETPEGYNYTTVIYTGIKNAELGLLNNEKTQIELYDLENGFLTTVLKLPESQITYPAFNFSFCNDIYWLFNKETRVWTAYK
ncbi:MAG: hypothetical protein ABI666_11305 [Ferruginibacter sp.]